MFLDFEDVEFVFLFLGCFCFLLGLFLEEGIFRFVFEHFLYSKGEGNSFSYISVGKF